MNVKSEVEESYKRKLQERLAGLVFNQIEKSWYKDGDKITNNWAGGTREYARLLRKVGWTSFDTVKIE